MSLLRDAEIEQLLCAVPSLIDDFDASVLNTSRSPVRGSSIDLTIGDIFVPGVEKPTSLGGVRNPRSRISLKCGQTVVLKSAEKLRMPKEISGIGFPPSTKVSLAGLLSTNSGHVDPDYCGYLHLTVVNMSGEEFPLARGDRLMRLMLFRLTAPVQYQIGEPPSPLTEDLLHRLSQDFLDIDERARNAAKKEELSLRSWQVWATIGTALVTGMLALGYQYVSGQREIVSQIAKLEGRLNSLGGSLNVVSFEDEVRKVKDMEQRLKLLEGNSRSSIQTTNAPGAR